MNESSNKRAVVVGVFIIIGLAFLTAGVLVIGNLHETFSRKIRVVTILDDVSGLQTGNNIWFSGVKIGTVKHLEFFDKSSVKVVMKIDRTVRPYIRKDAKVKISTDGLIGNKIIVIYGGTSEAGEVGDGDTLGVEETLSTENMMNTLQESNKNLLDITNDIKAVTKKLAAGESSAGKILDNDSLYQKIDQAASSLKRAGKNAERMIGSLAEFSAKLNRKGTFINDLVTDTSTYKTVRNSAKSLQQASDSASALVTQIRQSTAGVKSPAGVLLNDEASATHLKSILGNLDNSSRKLDEDLEGLQHSFLLRKYFRKKNKK
jgi:phospholipid/cholesterol/gamma-HCH transport system substrate-binding protein